VYSKLKDFLALPEFQTTPQPAYACDLNSEVDTGDEAKVPKLLRAYLAVGARICGPPALDERFKTIDFLTLLDLADVPKGLFARATS